MFFTAIEELIWRYRRLMAVLIVILIIQFFELSFLRYKYEIFTGGFLQPYSYKSTYDRIIFIFLSFWFDSALFSTLGIIWFYMSGKLNRYGVIVYYNFTIIIMLLMGAWLGFKYEVFSYFNDTLNFEILANLGGGSLIDALLYTRSEIALFLSVIGVITVFFLLCAYVLSGFNYLRSFPKNEKQGLVFLELQILVLLITPFITFFVSNDDYLRYGLEKKTSYSLISAGLDKLSDIDFDGYGSFIFPKDKEIFNSEINPGALDIPGNGIDEDGYIGDAEIPVINDDSFAEIDPIGGKHIVLIVLESARADLLHTKINEKFVAPEIRKIASIGSSIAFAYSHTGYTTTSIKAIFNRSLIKQSGKKTLVEFLQAAGYQLSFISGQDESFGNVAEEVGMKNEGVYYFDARSAIDDRVFPSKAAGSLRLSEERVVEQFQLRINKMDFSKPQFIYLNFQSAHFPYAYPKMQKRIINNLIPRSAIKIENKPWVTLTYWNAIANADWAVGKVMALLKKRNLFKTTTIAILADHGESLFDYGFLGHGHALNDTQTQIPFILNESGIEVDESIGQVDIAELVVRSALGLKKQWKKSDKVVFQMVGNLTRPTLIAHVMKGGNRTIFDFRTEQVFFSEKVLWMPYQQALLDPLYKDRVELLIREWEALRWWNFQAKNR